MRGQPWVHPEFAVRQDALLVSINDRLGGKPGREIEPLSLSWLEESLLLAWEEAEEMAIARLMQSVRR